MTLWGKESLILWLVNFVIGLILYPQYNLLLLHLLLKILILYWSQISSSQLFSSTSPAQHTHLLLL